MNLQLSSIKKLEAYLNIAIIPKIYDIKLKNQNGFFSKFFWAFFFFKFLRLKSPKKMVETNSKKKISPKKIKKLKKIKKTQ